LLLLRKGADRLQVLTGSFAIRLKTLTRAEVLPKTLWTALEERAPNFIKWAEVVSAHPSVTSIFDEREVVESTRAKIAHLKANA
jgi:hypothetical protein